MSMFAAITHFFKTTGSFSTDMFVLAGVFFVFFFFGMYTGKSRLISILLAFYPARILYDLFPFMTKVLILQGPQLLVLNKLIVFAVFFILCDIMIGKYIFSESFGGSSHFLSIATYAVACVVLVLLLTYTLISLDIFYNFSPTIDALFASSAYVFWWSLVPVGILLLF